MMKKKRYRKGAGIGRALITVCVTETFEVLSFIVQQNIAKSQFNNKHTKTDSPLQI